MKTMTPLSCFFLCLLLFPQVVLAGASCPPGEVDESVLAVAYQGGEKLSYRISWSGGPKIGEMHLELTRVPGAADRYQLQARVQDSGLFHFFYPVDDTFTTVVEGKRRLPVSYEVHQKEGRDYQALRFSEYDQENGVVRYRKNDLEPVEYEVEGQVHNEFSSFFISRVLQLDPEQDVTVSTFADGKRHEVVVQCSEPFLAEGTLLGDVQVVAVTPLMNFKGLYNKDGDTVIWLTDDACRVPVRIESKILIGSLTAELVSYSNPLCNIHPECHEKSTEETEDGKNLEQGD
ncbi:MAG: DUF3108 domain-containing protein [Thermodesulfobacteriota bacterium]